MNTLTESVQILRDAGGHPAFAVIPFADYQALVKAKTKTEPGIPAAVVDLAMDNEWSAARAHPYRRDRLILRRSARFDSALR